MLKLHQHFTTNFSIVFIVVLLLSSLVSYFTLKEIELQTIEKELKSNIKLIRLQMPFTDHKDTLDTFAKAIKKSTNARVTLVNEDGIVIAESDFDINNMDNHAFREEILDAKENEFGVHIRHSNTLGIDFMYVAHQLLYDGKPLFIRLAVSTEQIKENFLAIWHKLAIIFGIAMLISFGVSLWLNRKLGFELKKLEDGLIAISNKDYKTTIKATFAQEFVDIANIVHQLTIKLAKRDRQKRKYTARLRLVNKQRSDIISAISHEFKNPIASIMGYAETLHEDINADEAIRQRFLGKIITNSQKITDMINRLALSTKLENGDLKPKESSVDLAKLTSEVVSQFQRNHPNREFSTTLETSIVKCDGTMIEMVLNNLIDNALKYSQSIIHVRVKDGLCEVEDFGEGIPKDEIHEVSKKFYRSNRLSWDNSIGLGLSLVTYMLKLNNSELKIKSEVGNGSTFSFKLK